MKRLYTIILAVLLTTSLMAQSPEKMSYQSVIRNSSDQLLSNQAIGMQISILQGTITGTAVYTETQSISTNANGLVTLEIGTGISSDDFSAIDWANGPYFIKTETDPTGGTNYTITGTSQLMSVPYALHAKTADSISGGISVVETDPSFTSSEAANITAGDISNLGNLSGTNTGDQDISGIAANTTAIANETTRATTAEGANSTAISTLQGEQTTQNTAIALNTAKDTTGIYHANRVALNAVTGVNTGDQDLSGIATNTTAITTETTRATTAEGANSTAITTLQGEQTTQNTAIAKNTAKDTTGIYHANRADLDLVSGTNTGDQDGSETKLTAGTNITVSGSGTTTSPYVVNATGATTLTIGQSYQGGKIFWLDATGQHGLIAATADQSTGIQWYNGTYRYTGTTGDGLYAGAMNTTLIVATQMADNLTGNFATKVCADYSVTYGGVTYGDWYLPSKYELNLLYLQKTTVGGFASAYYWSSTEYGNNNNFAWYQNFHNGNQDYFNFSKYYTCRVRAVRAF